MKQRIFLKSVAIASMLAIVMGVFDPAIQEVMPNYSNPVGVTKNVYAAKRPVVKKTYYKGTKRIYTYRKTTFWGNNKKKSYDYRKYTKAGKMTSRSVYNWHSNGRLKSTASYSSFRAYGRTWSANRTDVSYFNTSGQRTSRKITTLHSNKKVSSITTQTYVRGRIVSGCKLYANYYHSNGRIKQSQVTRTGFGKEFVKYYNTSGVITSQWVYTGTTNIKYVYSGGGNYMRYQYSKSGGALVKTERWLGGKWVDINQKNETVDQISDTERKTTLKDYNGTLISVKKENLVNTEWKTTELTTYTNGVKTAYQTWASASNGTWYSPINEKYEKVGSQYLLSYKATSNTNGVLTAEKYIYQGMDWYQKNYNTVTGAVKSVMYWEFDYLGYGVGNNPVLSWSNLATIPTKPQATQEMICVKLLNEARIKSGLSPLKINAKLSKGAEIRASEIEAASDAGYPPHYRPDGKTSATIYAEVGYSAVRGGENVTAVAPTQPGFEAYYNWETSDGHKYTMMQSDVKDIGVGFYLDAVNGGYYVVMVTGALN